MSTLFITGGAGFIGSNFIRYMLRSHADVRIVNFDKLTYAGNLESLEDCAGDPRYYFIKGDICVSAEVRAALDAHPAEAIIHFAAESHVDRSIMGPAVFVETNVVGTQVLLDAARESGITRFIHVSTDEVYGSLGSEGKFTESTSLHPNSPYAASKASSDMLALAYHHTFGLPVIVTRCSNNYGPYQFPEKLIPLMIINAMNDKPLPVYGDGLNVRDWLYVEDHCRAIDLILEKGRPGEVYNIGGENEWKNLDIVKLILKNLNKPESLIAFVKDRPGHDRRYAIDASKIKNDLGWYPEYSLDEWMARTIEWYRRNEMWWNHILSGEYAEYYRKAYDSR